MLDPRSHSPQALAAQLSARERDVIEMALLGMTNGEIASRLSVTIHAVKFHLSSIYRKLGVANRTEAVVTYLRNDSTEGTRD